MTSEEQPKSPVLVKPIPISKYGKPKISHIRDVWVNNFFDELAIVANYIDQSYNIIAFVRYISIYD